MGILGYLSWLGRKLADVDESGMLPPVRLASLRPYCVLPAL
jgi:hypothetical protein